jgi:glycosyltransferase involved in cell wall biosynthesis
VTGYTADIGDVDTMSKYALMLLEDESLLRKFSQNALEQAKRFDISIILPQYEAYYQKILAEFKGKLAGKQKAVTA